MFIKKDRPGSAPGYTWEKGGEVKEVPDYLAEELLMIYNGGFSIADDPKKSEEPDKSVAPEPEGTPEPTPEPDPLDEEDPAEVAEPKKGGRPKLPRDQHGKIVRN